MSIVIPSYAVTTTAFLLGVVVGAALIIAGFAVTLLSLRPEDG